MCLNASGVCMFEDASVGYPVLPVDTDDSCHYALLELFEHVDPCLTAIKEGGENNSHVSQL